MKKVAIGKVIGLILLSTSSYASQSGMFVGLGGSYQSINLNQDVDLVGISKVYSGSTLVAYGNAVGPANPYHNTQSTLAPEAQVGYFSHLANSDKWLWGAKLVYAYVSTTSTDQDIVSPQAGQFTTVSGVDSFTGHATIQSAQTSLSQEFLALPFIGYSLKDSYVYIGAGPALLSTQTKMYDVTGYADVNGVHMDVTGTPSNFSSSKWMWAAAVQTGMTYYLDSSWTVDLNYMFAITKNYTTNYSGAFTSLSGGYTTTGTMLGSVSQRFIAQSVGVSLNKVFS